MKGKNYNSQKGMSYPQKIQQVFSDELKRSKVKEIEMGLIRVSELSRSLGVSQTSIYRWIKKYSITYNKRIQVVVESKSQTKKLEYLQEQLKEAHRLLGQKQIQLEFTEKMLELASKELGIDIKKKYGTKR